MSLLDKMAETISRYSMFRPGARVGVAVSGGADSVCLAQLLAELKPEWNLHLGLVHLNHCLRGTESAGDEDFVQRLAARLGLPCVVEVRAVAAIPDNLEQAARLARLEFFGRLLAAGDFDRIATAHTRDDQAETVLFRMLRGSYTTGLSGIRPVTSGGLVRPLLYVSRTEVESYLREKGLPWREDSSNRDLAFDRNRIRHVLLPALTAEWNPRLPSILARHADLAREDEEFWDAEIDGAVTGRIAFTPGEAILDVRTLRGLAPAIARRLIRRAIAHVRGDLRQIDFRHVDEALALARPAAGGHARIQIPGVDLMRSFDWVRFARPGPVPRPEFAIPVAAPGLVEMPVTGVSIRLEIIERKADSAIGDILENELDWSRVRQLVSGMQLRNWSPGDRYRRAGHAHERKLKEFFHEFRVPLWERRAWPILFSGGRILWARKFGPAAEFAAGPSTSTVLHVLEGDR